MVRPGSFSNSMLFWLIFLKLTHHGYQDGNFEFPPDARFVCQKERLVSDTQMPSVMSPVPVCQYETDVIDAVVVAALLAIFIKGIRLVI